MLTSCPHVIGIICLQLSVYLPMSVHRRDMYSLRTPQKKSYFYPVRTNPHPSQYIYIRRRIFSCQLKYKLHIRNPDVESYRLVYTWVNSERAGGSRELGGGYPEFYWATFTKHYIYFWNPELKPSRLAPLLGDMIKGVVWVPGHRNTRNVPK